MLNSFTVISILLDLSFTGSDNYWWINCQFVPNDDTTLMVTSSAYILRSGMSNVQVRNIPAGKVCKFSMEPNGISKYNVPVLYNILYQLNKIKNWLS